MGKSNRFQFSLAVHSVLSWWKTIHVHWTNSVLLYYNWQRSVASSGTISFLISSFFKKDLRLVGDRGSDSTTNPSQWICSLGAPLVFLSLSQRLSGRLIKMLDASKVKLFDFRGPSPTVGDCIQCNAAWEYVRRHESTRLHAWTAYAVVCKFVCNSK